ncbi:hypothetical protein [Thermoanaerobacter sp. A7A]|uniref:hypothetical protein n=1 Tax=Thermoanaerobacter sp. A7A TaxID=1350366 RepID=UPI0003FB7B4C|nr:hypothetical protein [Thermoanaerobacter sp. A7A]
MPTRETKLVCDVNIIRALPVDLVARFLQYKRSGKVSERVSAESLALMYKMLVEDWDKTKAYKEIDAEQLVQEGGVLYVTESYKDFYPLSRITATKCLKVLFKDLGLIHIKRHFNKNTGAYSFCVFIDETLDEYELAHSKNIKMYRSDVAYRLYDLCQEKGITLDTMNATFLLCHLVYISRRGGWGYKLVPFTKTFDQLQAEIPWLSTSFIKKCVYFFLETGIIQKRHYQKLDKIRKLYTYHFNLDHACVVLATQLWDNEKDEDLTKVVDDSNIDYDTAQELKPVPYSEALKKTFSPKKVISGYRYFRWFTFLDYKNYNGNKDLLKQIYRDRCLELSKQRSNYKESAYRLLEDYNSPVERLRLYYHYNKIQEQNNNLVIEVDW